jgi:anthranilate synthase/aminodeoxychorismate synthase-like glutamine amidotransferase
VTLAEIIALDPDHIVISPGPGDPDDGGISNEVIRHFTGKKPVLGVCLGHQCMGHVFGGKVERAPRLMHGKVSPVYHKGTGLFTGIPSPFQATRYHSLIVEDPLPDVLEITAFTKEGEMMALRHKEHQTVGVQFHPESILTEHGKRILQNFLEGRI